MPRNRATRRSDRRIEEPSHPTPPTTRKWAVYFYLCADYVDREESERAKAFVADMRRNLEQILGAPQSAQMAVAAQIDEPDGARRYGPVVPGALATQGESIGAVNTGEGATLEQFLAWADQVCPGEHVALVIGGLGILERAGTVRGSRWGHLFSICDDSGNNDSMDLSDLGESLRRWVESRGAPIDLLAFDMCEIQFLEVAYELEGAVDVLVAPQTEVPSSGWDYTRVLEEWTAAIDRSVDVGARELARSVVAEAVEAYGAAKMPATPCCVSALDLRKISSMTQAFDAFTVALAQSLGDDLVWRMREHVMAELERTDAWSGRGSEDAASVERTEEQSAVFYDLGSMLEPVVRIAQDDADHVVTRWMDARLQDILGTRRRSSDWYARLGAAVENAVQNDTLLAPLAQKVRDSLYPPADAKGADSKARATLAEIFAKQAGEPPEDAAKRRKRFEMRLRDALDVLLHERTIVRPDWSPIPSDLRDGFQLLDSSRSQLQRIAELGRGVRGLLPSVPARGVDAATGDDDGESFVVAARRADDAAHRLLSGVSVHRPSNLDELRDLTYLQLRFHRQVHWAIYLTAVSLIKSHPAALWRVVSSLLSSASPAARGETMRVMTGPESMLVGFRTQLRALSAPASAQLTLDSREEPVSPGSSERAHFFWLRLASNVLDAAIPEHRSRVQRNAFELGLEELEAILGKASVSRDDVETFQSISSGLGDDVLASVKNTLALIEKRSDEQQSDVPPDDREPPHLQLQIARELMRYPWELLDDGRGRLSDRFAVARAAFLETSVARPVTARRPGPLRVLVIGDPRSDAAPPLPEAREEAAHIANLLEEFAKRSGGTVDFERDRDALIDTTVEWHRLKSILRGGFYDVVHFSGHAVADPVEPGSSAWLLSDLPLTAVEIRNALCNSPSPPWLVFANACESARDDGRKSGYPRDVFGLATAFIGAGVAAYVGPLWPISDAAASGMAKRFYEELVWRRRSLGSALFAARQEGFDLAFGERGDDWTELSTDLGLGWASFVLYGDPTATVAQLLGSQSAAASELPRKRPATGRRVNATAPRRTDRVEPARS